jgi:hypothetical protein
MPAVFSARSESTVDEPVMVKANCKPWVKVAFPFAHREIARPAVSTANAQCAPFSICLGVFCQRSDQTFASAASKQGCADRRATLERPFGLRHRGARGRAVVGAEWTGPSRSWPIGSTERASRRAGRCGQPLLRRHPLQTRLCSALYGSLAIAASLGAA